MKIKKMASILLVITMLFSVSISSMAVGFCDLSKSHWAYDNIVKLQGKGVLNGFPDGSFRPDQKVTRAEFSKILTSLYQTNNSCDIPLADVASNAWYEKPVKNAAWFIPCFVDQNNNMYFKPNQPISRVDAASALVSLFGLSNDQADQSNLNAFTDKNTMTENEKKIVSITVQNGLMNGKNGCFDPRGSLTRAEICTLLARTTTQNLLPQIINSYKNLINTNTVQHPVGKLKGNYYILFNLNNANCSGGSNAGQTPSDKPNVPQTPQKPETPQVPETPQKPEVPNVPTVPQKPDNGTQTVTASAYEKEVLNLVNQERAKNGLQPLKWANDLANVARAHSLDMATNNFFSHTNLKGQSPFDRMSAAGIKYSMAAENIAAGQTTPAEVMNSWMNSAGHRANILNPNLKELGVGYVKATNGSSYSCYWTQTFATR